MPVKISTTAISIAGNGAGLIQADGLHGPQGFHRVQMADQDMVPAHVPDAQGQGGGGCGRQPFRHRGGGQADGGAQHLQPAPAPDKAHQSKTTPQRPQQTTTS